MNRSIHNDFPGREKRQVKEQAEGDDEQKATDSSCKRSSPMMIFYPTLPCRDNKCQPCAKEKRGGAESMKEFVELEYCGLLPLGWEKRTDDMSFQHQQDNNTSVEVDEKEAPL